MQWLQLETWHRKFNFQASMYQIRIYYRAGILLQIIQVVFNGICQVRPLLWLSMQVAVASDPAKLHINLS